MGDGFGFRVVYPTPGILSKKGFGRVAHLPFIMDARPGYHRIGNQFLIDRGLGLWDPKQRGAEQCILPPSNRSMKNYADRLVNFLEWCAIRSKDLLQVDYKIDLIQQYQSEMINGIWSRDGVGLSAKTVNVRIELAIDFLTWAADKGLRKEFLVPRVIKAYAVVMHSNSAGTQIRSVEARKGKVREDKRRIGFPKERQIFDWLQRLYQRSFTEGLLAETILETAVRRAEAAALRVDTLPIDPNDWRIANPEMPTKYQAVLVELIFNTKGKEYGHDHGDKIGPKGTIRVPMPLALKIHEYREKIRPKALRIAVRKGRTRMEQQRILNDTVHLFLNPISGKRFTGENIYEFWRSVERPKGWSPHLARDFWACSILWKRIQEHKLLLESALERKVDDSLMQTLQLQALSIIQLEIQPQLRHVSQETTMIYLQWLSDFLGVNLNLHERWTEKLSENDTEFSL